MDLCPHCLQPLPTHHPDCPDLVGKTPEYENGFELAKRGAALSTLPDGLLNTDLLLGYMAGEYARERGAWQEYEATRLAALQRDLFHERLISSRKKKLLIHRSPQVPHSQIASRMGSDGDSRDWMIRASYSADIDRWVTVPIADKGICCITSIDPYTDWEVLLIVGSNPKGSVLFVEPHSILSAARRIRQILPP